MDPATVPHPPEDNINPNIKMCRFCEETTEGTSAKAKLISPCACRGSIAYVHRGCLDTWRAVSPNARSFTHCDACGKEYLVTYNSAKRISARFKFAVLLFRDFGGLFVVLNLIVLGLGFALYGVGFHKAMYDVYGWSALLQHYEQTWSSALKLTLLIYSMGGSLFFFVLGLGGCCLACTWCCDSDRDGYTRDRALSHRAYPRYYYSGSRCCDDVYFIYCISCDRHSPTRNNCCACSDTRRHAGGGGGGSSANCGDCNCNCSGGSSGGGGGDCGELGAILAVVALVVVVVIILIGIAFGIMLLIGFITSVLNRHSRVLYRKSQTEVWEVLDLNVPARGRVLPASAVQRGGAVLSGDVAAAADLEGGSLVRGAAGDVVDDADDGDYVKLELGQSGDMHGVATERTPIKKKRHQSNKRH